MITLEQAKRLSPGTHVWMVSEHWMEFVAEQITVDGLVVVDGDAWEIPVDYFTTCAQLTNSPEVIHSRLGWIHSDEAYVTYSEAVEEADRCNMMLRLRE